MNATTRMWIIGLAGALLGGAIAAGATWSVQNNRIKDLETESAKLEAQLDAASDAATGPAGSSQPTTSEAATTSAPPTAPPAALPEGHPAASTAEDGKHFCFIKTATWSGSTPKITVDYAEFLTGDAAAAAAAAAGEESPPPNDFFISNKNKKLRTFPMSTSAKIKMITKADNLVMEGYAMTVPKWFDAFSGMSGYFPAIKTVPYWITIKNGTVIKIEEQYLP